MPRDFKFQLDLDAAIRENHVGEVMRILQTRAMKRESRIFNCRPEPKDRTAEELAPALYKAAKIQDSTILRCLLDNGAEANFYPEEIREGSKSSGLHVAVRRGLLDSVSVLLDYNADVNKRDHRGRTPLHVAVKSADCAITRALLCHGADIHAVDLAGNNPLQVASRFGHIELVRLLLEHNASLFTKNQKGPSPLHIASSEGHVPLLDLFSHYVDLNVMSTCDDQLEKAPLHLCTEKGYIEAVRFLLERHSVDVNVLTSAQQTALHATLNQSHDPKRMRRREDFDMIVDILVKKGINVNQQDKCGNTALHLAALYQHHKAAELLILCADTDLHIRNKDSLLAVDLIPGFDLCMKQIFSKYSAFASNYLASGGRHTPGCPCSPNSVRSSVDGLSVTFDKISIMAEPSAPTGSSLQ